jgi:hypothetical protein
MGFELELEIFETCCCGSPLDGFELELGIFKACYCGPLLGGLCL